MKVAVTRSELMSYLDGKDRRKLGFVPTMGALHRGHLSLVERARRENAAVVVSVFVNPTQFNDPGDLERYPRTPDQDLKMLEDAGVDIVFMPTVTDIYPEPDTRVFDFGQLDRVMEGATRPGHFNGVAQVVSRLFDIVRPARAYFGEKDFQQVAVVKEMVRQTGSDVEIITCPTVRENDGLAMSSRNTLLTPQHRAAAPKIYAAMKEAADKVANEGGKASVAEVEREVTDAINSDPGLEVIYFKLVNAATLQPAKDFYEKEGVQGCVAVQAGKVRLIDNLAFTKNATE